MGEARSRRRGQSQTIATERVESQTDARQLIRSLLRLGTSVAAIPLDLLPQSSRSHIQEAGRESIRGIATLIRELADGLETVSAAPGESATRESEVKESEVSESEPA